MISHNVRFYWKRYRELGRAGMPLSSLDDIPGVETHKAVYLTALRYDGPSGADAQPYEPISDDVFHAVMEALPIDRAQYTFIDLGSGKGRAVLLAARAGFKLVVGVEYSSELHRKAAQNLAYAWNHLPDANRVALLNADAGEYAPPMGRLVYYLFNPFGEQVMNRVIARMSQALRQGRFDDLWVLYGNPVHETLFESCGFLQKVTRRANFAVYRVRTLSE